jgi:DNA-binding NarL/FixJ family response regulator
MRESSSRTLDLKTDASRGKPFVGHRQSEILDTRVLSAVAGQPRERAMLARATAEARTALEDAAVAAAQAAARARSVATVLDEALAVLAAAERAVSSAPHEEPALRSQIGGLSPREQEVLAMVAEGCSNKAIAEAL